MSRDDRPPFLRRSRGLKRRRKPCFLAVEGRHHQCSAMPGPRDRAVGEEPLAAVAMPGTQRGAAIRCGDDPRAGCRFSVSVQPTTCVR